MTRLSGDDPLDLRPRMSISENEEYAAITRLAGAMVGRGDIDNVGFAEDRARIYVFVVLASLGIEVERDA